MNITLKFVFVGVMNSSEQQNTFIIYHITVVNRQKE